MKDLSAGRHGVLVHEIDLGVRLDGEPNVMEAGRVELELLLLERLPQSERAGACAREAEIVDLLAAFAGNEMRRLEPEWAEHRRIKAKRPLEVAADEIDVPDADEQC